MAEESEASNAGKAGYVPGYGANAHQYMVTRSADSEAAFLLPHLREGMRVLDCGSGAGTITLGLASVVRPGEVVGIDLEPLQVQRAQQAAAEQGVPNVRFEVGDIFALPFEEGSFDVVFAHAVLLHLGDRLAALREFRRVLRPGGIVAVKDIKTTDQIFEPASQELRDFLKLLELVRRHNGIAPSEPHRYRSVLREAGFVDVEVSAMCTSYGTHETVRRIAAFHLEQARRPVFQQTVREQGWADQSRLDAICTALETWSQSPDAFRVELWCAAIGHRPASGAA